MLLNKTFDSQELKETMEKLSKQFDPSGILPDTRIVETIALLHMHGFPSIQSSYGNAITKDIKSLPYPWIILQTSRQAKEQLLAKTGESAYYKFKQETKSIAENKTVSKFGIPAKWNSAATMFYEHKLKQARRNHVNYNYYADTRAIIQSEHRKLRPELLSFLDEFLSFYWQDITVTQDSLVKILFSSPWITSENHVDFSIQQRKVLLERGRPFVKLLNASLKRAF